MKRCEKTFWTNILTNGLTSPEKKTKTKQNKKGDMILQIIGCHKNEVKMLCFPIIPCTFLLYKDFIGKWFWEKKILSFHPGTIILLFVKQSKGYLINLIS